MVPYFQNPELLSETLEVSFILMSAGIPPRLLETPFAAKLDIISNIALFCPMRTSTQLDNKFFALDPFTSFLNDFICWSVFRQQSEPVRRLGVEGDPTLSGLIGVETSGILNQRFRYIRTRHRLLETDFYQVRMDTD